MSKEKRMFIAFDEMNQNDEKNKTATLGACYEMVEAKTAKGGGHVTMGVPAEAIMNIFTGKVQPILLLLDKKEYEKVMAQSPSTDTGSEWISVEDGLPKQSGQVLGIMKDTLDIYVCHYKKDRKLFQVYGHGADPISDMSVTHWMPLPKSPKSIHHG